MEETKHGPVYITFEYHPERGQTSFEKIALKSVLHEEPSEPHIKLLSRAEMWSIEPETTFVEIRCEEKIVSVNQVSRGTPGRPPFFLVVDLGLLLNMNSSELPTLPLNDSY